MPEATNIGETRLGHHSTVGVLLQEERAVYKNRGRRRDEHMDAAQDARDSSLLFTAVSPDVFPRCSW